MKPIKFTINLISGLLLIIFIIATSSVSAQKYNKCKGKNIIYQETSSGSNNLSNDDSATAGESKQRKETHNRNADVPNSEESYKKIVESNEYKSEEERIKVAGDVHGNAQGNQYDLAVDGAFEGETVAVLHLYTCDEFDFELPKAALKEKGFSVYRWINNPPSPEELKSSLEKACQLWIISDSYRKLTPEHLAVIKDFFETGKGLYIMGDNNPYYADANYVSEYIFGVKMYGDLPGNEVVGLNNSGKNIGVTPGHLVTTGLENVYEGVTIATIEDNKNFTPLIYGHEGNMVTAAYEKDGKRAIIDGGFTRLYVSWDKAGTGRFVKNAAAWLVNYERNSEEILLNVK